MTYETDQRDDQAAVFYDEFRTCELNKEYYGRQLRRRRMIVQFVDIYVALFSGGMVLFILSYNGINITENNFLVEYIMWFAVFATFISIAKPILRLESEVERLSSILGTYVELCHMHLDLVNDIKARKNITDMHNQKFEILRNIRGRLSSSEDQAPDRDFVLNLQSQVEKRYPENFFWWPSRDISPTASSARA